MTALTEITCIRIPYKRSAELVSRILEPLQLTLILQPRRRVTNQAYVRRV